MSDPVPVAFEAALAELEQIVDLLESGGPDLSQALAGYGRGVALLGHCQSILDQAERSVALLTGVSENGAAITSPFDSAATATATSAAFARSIDPVSPPDASTTGENLEPLQETVPQSTSRKSKTAAMPFGTTSEIPEAPF